MQGLCRAGRAPSGNGARRRDPRDYERGADVESRDKEGNTPLHCACRNRQLRAVEMLLAAGADTEATSGHGWRPIHEAIGPPDATRADESKDVAAKLLEAGASTDIFVASALGKPEDVSAMLEIQPKLLFAKDARYRGTPLHWAARKGNTVVVRLLLREGGKVRR